MWRGRSAISSPQRMPVSIAVSTRSRCRSGIAAMSRSYSAGVRVRDFRAMTLGSSVCSHGLATMSWSRTARLKIECSMVWYLRIDRGDSPSAAAWVTQSWTRERGDLVHQLPAEERVEVLVQVGDVGGLRGGLDVLAGQPVGLDVVAEGDRAEAGVAPGAGEDFLLLAVAGAFGGAASGVGAGGADPALGVAVAGHEAGGAVVVRAFDPTPCRPPRLAMSARCPRTLPKVSERWRKFAESRKVPLTCDYTSQWLTLSVPKRAS